MIEYIVYNRWTGQPQFTAKIDARPDTGERIKRGLAVEWAVQNRSSLSSARLEFADLRGANLTDADFRGADLWYANLTAATLKGAYLEDANFDRAILKDTIFEGAKFGEAPAIPNIHSAVYAAARQEGALDMCSWHQNSPCGTTHCRAGWVVNLAGKEGLELEKIGGTAAAALAIYAASDPGFLARHRAPDFYESNEAALEDMRKRAKEEAALA